MLQELKAGGAVTEFGHVCRFISNKYRVLYINAVQVHHLLYWLFSSFASVERGRHDELSHAGWLECGAEQDCKQSHCGSGDSLRSCGSDQG